MIRAATEAESIIVTFCTWAAGMCSPDITSTEGNQFHTHVVFLNQMRIMSLQAFCPCPNRFRSMPLRREDHFNKWPSFANSIKMKIFIMQISQWKTTELRSWEDAEKQGEGEEKERPMWFHYLAGIWLILPTMPFSRDSAGSKPW